MGRTDPIISAFRLSCRVGLWWLFSFVFGVSIVLPGYDVLSGEGPVSLLFQWFRRYHHENESKAE